jgi:4-hydroxy-tetrahydrodipicolinate synthase
MTLFHGLSAFPLTPTDADGRVQTDLLRGFVERIVASGADSIGVLGSTGAYAFLAREQRKRAVEAAVKTAAGRTSIIAGVGALRTNEATSLAKDAEAAGANGLLLAPVSYTPLFDAEVFQHFRAVASATALPLCIYNNPGATKFTFSLDLIARLADVSNIKAVKMPLTADGDFKTEIALLRAKTPEDFAVGYSGDWGSPAALLAGADAWYSVVAGLLPEATLKLACAAKSGHTDETARITAEFEPLWALFKEFGSFRVMYAIADILYPGIGIEPPRPVLPTPLEARARIHAAVEQALRI